MAKAKVEVPKQETITQAQLKRAVLDTMEDDLRISPKQASDFIDSLLAVVQEGVEEGKKVSVFGLVTLTPSFKLATPKRTGNDPRTGEERTFDAQPAKTRIRASVGSKVKDALPSTSSKAGKLLKSITEARRAASEERARLAEKEAAKAAKGGKGKSKGKKGK